MAADAINTDIQSMQTTLAQLQQDEKANPSHAAADTQEINQINQLLSELEEVQNGVPDFSTDINNITTQLGIINSNTSNPNTFSQANLTAIQTAEASMQSSVNDIKSKVADAKSPPNSDQSIEDMQGFADAISNGCNIMYSQIGLLASVYQDTQNSPGNSSYKESLSADLSFIQYEMVPSISNTVNQYATTLANNTAADLNKALAPIQAQVNEAQKSTQYLLKGLPANFSHLPLMEQAVLISNYAISQMNKSLTNRLASISKENKALSQYNKYLQVCKNGTTLKPSQAYTAPASFLQFINSCVNNGTLPQSVINQLPGQSYYNTTTGKWNYVTTAHVKGSGGGGGQWAADQTSIQNLIQDQTTQINEQMDFVQNTMDQQSNAMQMVSTIIQQGSTADTSVTSAIGAI